MLILFSIYLVFGLRSGRVQGESKFQRLWGKENNAASKTSTPCSDCDFLRKKRGDVELLPGLYHCTLAEKAWEKVPVIRLTSSVTV